MDNVRLEARTDGDPIDTSKQHKCTSRLLMRWTLHQATSVVAKAITRCMLLEAAPHGHLSSTNKLLTDPMTKSTFQKAPTERNIGRSGVREQPAVVLVDRMRSAARDSKGDPGPA